MFERDGFLGARVADIAAEAGVAHGTFYTYFDSKAAVFRVLVAEALAMIYDTGSISGDEPDLTALQRIERANRQFIRVYREYGTMLALMEQAVTYDDEVRDIRLAARHTSVERVRRSIERLQRDGSVPTELDPLIAACALVSMVSNFVYFWLVLEERAHDSEQAVRMLTRLWASALELTP